MIIKFRESRIAKLESSKELSTEDKSKFVADLKKEITIWKEAADSKASEAKLLTEKAEL